MQSNAALRPRRTLRQNCSGIIDAIKSRTKTARADPSLARQVGRNTFDMAKTAGMPTIPHAATGGPGLTGAPHVFQAVKARLRFLAFRLGDHECPRAVRLCGPIMRGCFVCHIVSLLYRMKTKDALERPGGSSTLPRFLPFQACRGRACFSPAKAKILSTT